MNMVNISAKYKHVHIWLKALLFLSTARLDVVSLAKVINTFGSMCAQGDGIIYILSSDRQHTKAPKHE